MPYKLLSRLKPTEGRYHSSILLTYSFDADFYGQVIRRKLSQIGANNQIVLMDAGCYEQTLSWDLSSARDIGRLYSVSPIFNTTAFHPKILFLLGKEGGRLIVGSGNATTGGFLKNWEIFGEFEALADEPIPPAFREAWQLIESLKNLLPETVQYQLSKSRDMSAWLANSLMVGDNRELLINTKEALFHQIIKRINERSPKNIVLISPYWDEKLEVLNQLKTALPKSKFSLIVQSDIVNLSGAAVSNLGKHFQWYNFNAPYGDEEWSLSKRAFLHAKLLLFELPDEDLAFYGSANISRAALLKKPPSGNYEILIGIRFPKGEVRKRLALQQSIDAAPITVDLISKKWLSAERSASDKRHIALIAVELEENLLTVKVDATLSIEARLQLFSITQEKLMELPLRLDNKSNLYIASSRSSTRDCHFAKVISKGQESNLVAITDRASIISACMPPLQAKYEKALNDISGGRISIDIVDIVELLADHLYNQSVSKDHVVNRGRKTEVPSQEQRKPIEVDAGLARREASKSSGYSSDIDLLVSLFGPTMPKRRPAKEEPDWSDEEAMLDEEARKEEVNRGTDEERPVGVPRREKETEIPSRIVAEKAKRKLRRRLEGALERVAECLDDEAPFDRHQLLRCCAMVRIGAAILNREIETLEGAKIILLDDRIYSEFVLEMARILFGGKKGGLIARCPSETWKSIGRSETIKALQLLRTAMTYAALKFPKYIDEASKDTEEETDGIYYGALYSDLVGARLAAFLDSRKIGIDTSCISTICMKESLHEKDLRQTDEKFSVLAKKIKRIETSPKYPERISQPEQGDYVFSAVLGVTVVDEIEGDKMILLDFDSEKDVTRKYQMKSAKYYRLS